MECDLPLCSGPSASSKRSFLRFINSTQRNVDIIWIDYQGKRVTYQTLAPADWYDINTYASHPWIFRDSDTCDKLVVNSEEVFDPPSWIHNYFKEHPSHTGAIPPGYRPSRILFRICIPVYSLRERSLQVVRKLLRNRRDAFDLDIPRSLQIELARSRV